MHAFAGGGVCLLEASCCSTKYGRFVTLTEPPNMDLLHSNTITRLEPLATTGVVGVNNEAKPWYKTVLEMKAATVWVKIGFEHIIRSECAIVCVSN